MYRRIFFIFYRRLALLPLAIFVLTFLSGCGPVETEIHGTTMGTTYSIKIMTSRWNRTGHLSDLIDTRLQEINSSMSTYMSDSEISTFNDIHTNEPFTASADFLAVMRVAKDIHKLSRGAWDGSLDPLVRLWGFGKDEHNGEVPTAQEIETALSLVDFSQISLSSDGKLIKIIPQMTIDLSSIAKGYGVDAIAVLLHEEGYEDFLIEIGGEVFVSGKKDENSPWRVGINTPSKTVGFGEVYKVLSLEGGRGLATSGDYKNFFISEGRTYSHVLDPRTGAPVTNGVVSVSVIAKTCTFADGLATALMVMGPGPGIELVEQLDNVEAFFIVQSENDELKEYGSSGFEKFEP